MPIHRMRLQGTLWLLVCLVFPLLSSARAGGPTLSSPLNTSVCSGTPFTYVPASASPQVSYTWTRAAVAGISNPAASGEGAISESLDNATISPIVVTYVYTINSNGATNTENVNVTVNPTPHAGFTESNPNPCLGTLTSFTNTSTIGAGTMTYQWNFGDGRTSTLTNPTHSFANAGAYPVTLTVTSSAGCSSAARQTSTVSGLPVADYTGVFTTSPGPGSWNANFTSTSQGGAIPIAANGYNWSFNGVAASGMTASYLYTIADAPWYTSTLTVTNTAGCVSNPLALQYLEPGQNYGNDVPFLVGSAAGLNNTDTMCLGAGATFYFTNETAGLPPGTKYYWLYGDASPEDSSGPNVSHTYTTAGTYVVEEWVSANYGLSASSTYHVVDVFPSAGPITLTPSTAIVLCPGQRSQPVAFGPDNAQNIFSWAVTGGATGAPAGGTTNYFPEFSATANATGSPIAATLTVTVTSPYGCGSGQTATIPITVNPSPAVTTAFTPQTVCSGTTLTGYTLTSDVAGATFTWANSDPVTGLPASGAGNIPSFTASTYAPAPETSTVTVTANAAGCLTSATYTYTVDATPTLDTPFALPAICSGTAFQYTPTLFPAGTTYIWNRPGEPGIQEPGTMNTTPIDETLTNLTLSPVTVPYNFTLTAPSGCSNFIELTVPVNPNATVFLPPNINQLTCNGAETNPITFTGAFAGTTYSWTNSDPAIGLPASGNGNFPAFQAVNPGNSNVVATINVLAQTPQGCDLLTPVTFLVTVEPSEPPVIDTPQGTILCLGDTLNLSAQSIYAVSYQWYLDGNTINGATSGTLPVTAAGNYTAATINAEGCSSPNDTPVVITVLPSPLVSFQVTPAYCEGQPFNFTNTSSVAGGYDLIYLWQDSKGDTSTAASPTFTYNTPGSVTMTLSAYIAGCLTASGTKTEQIAVVAPTPGTNLPAVNTEPGVPIQLDAPNIGDSSVEWNPGTGLSNPDIQDPVATLNSPQVYTITMLTDQNCTTIDTLTVRVIPADEVYIPGGFTPNGDGINDLFVIAGLNNYPGSPLTIFDRWGKTVYTSSGYQNDWNGGNLPVGTYVYVLQLKTKSGYRIFKGTLELMR